MSLKATLATSDEVPWIGRNAVANPPLLRAPLARAGLRSTVIGMGAGKLCAFVLTGWASFPFRLALDSATSRRRVATDRAFAGPESRRQTPVAPPSTTRCATDRT